MFTYYSAAFRKVEQVGFRSHKEMSVLVYSWVQFFCGGTGSVKVLIWTDKELRHDRPQTNRLTLFLSGILKSEKMEELITQPPKVALYVPSPPLL